MLNYFYWFDKEFNLESCSKRYSYKHVTKDNKEILAVNCAGFSKEDIQLTTESIGDKDYLYITGTPKEDIKDFIEPLKLRFEIKSNLVETVEGDVKDGMLYIAITRKNNKPKINIKF